MGVFLPVWAVAQSDSGEPSLGDLARQYRKGKAALEHAVIDNDNLHQVMDEVQTRKLDGKLLFSIDGIGKKFQVSSPDVTCDLSFSGSATSLLSDPYAPQDLPEGELAKLDGPATISGDTLQVSVHNGTTWNIREITVGVTIAARLGGKHRPARFSAPDTSGGNDHVCFRKNSPIQLFSTTSKARPHPPAQPFSTKPGHDAGPGPGMALGDRAGERGSFAAAQSTQAAIGIPIGARST